MEGWDRAKVGIETYRLKAKFLEDLWEEISSGDGFTGYSDVVDWVQERGYRDKLSLRDLWELGEVIRRLFPGIQSVKVVCGCLRYYLAS